ELDFLVAENHITADTYNRALKKLQSTLFATGKTVKGLVRPLMSLEDATSSAKSIFEQTRDPLEKYNAELERLQFLLDEGHISQDTFNRSLQGIQDELLKSNKGFEVFGDVVDGVFDKSLNGIGDFVKYGKKMLTDFLKDMIMKFARSKFVPNIGAASGGNAGNMLGSLGSLMGGGGDGGSSYGMSGAGTASSLLSFAGMGSKLSAIGGGTGFWGGLGGAVSGGMQGMFSGAGISGAASAAGGGAMATIGAAVPVVLAVAAAVSFFKSKTKELDNGLRLTAQGADLAVDSFKLMEKKKYWGMSKKQYTTYGSVDQEVSDPFIEAFSAIYKQVEDGAKSLGVNANVFKSFSDTIKVSLKGLSAEEQSKAIADALNGFGNSLADLIPGINRFALRGEEANSTLQRLSGHLAVVNDVFRTLGHTAFEGSLAGANMAYELSQMMGGLEAFTAKTGAYYDAFYTDAEKLENSTLRMNEALAELGLQMPTSTEAFRDLVDGSMAIGDLDIAAALIELAPAFKLLQDATEASQQAIEDLAMAEAEAARQRQEEYAAKVAMGRASYGLKTDGFKTSFESKRAEDMARKEKSSNQLIEEQNALNRITNELLLRLNVATDETNRAIDEQNNNVVVN
ncbi:MAG: hypothetical protein P8P29_06280, partial [Flavobacteriaceae bacterium]|nr:hypothetical protein [Flavobacteriaceae bacterium]